MKRTSMLWKCIAFLLSISKALLKKVFEDESQELITRKRDLVFSFTVIRQIIFKSPLPQKLPRPSLSTAGNVILFIIYFQGKNSW